MYIVRHTCIEGLLWCRLLVKGTLEDLKILVVSKPQLAHVRSCTGVPCDLTGSLMFNCETSVRPWIDCSSVRVHAHVSCCPSKHGARMVHLPTQHACMPCEARSNTTTARKSEARMMQSRRASVQEPVSLAGSWREIGEKLLHMGCMMTMIVQFGIGF